MKIKMQFLFLPYPLSVHHTYLTVSTFAADNLTRILHRNESVTENTNLASFFHRWDDLFLLFSFAIFLLRVRNHIFITLSKDSLWFLSSCIYRSCVEVETMKLKSIRNKDVLGEIVEDQEVKKNKLSVTQQLDWWYTGSYIDRNKQKQEQKKQSISKV